MSTPAMTRLLDTLRDQGPMTIPMLASTAYIAYGTAKTYARACLAARLIHIKPDVLGAKVYAFGPGTEPPKLTSRSPRFPDPIPPAERFDPYQERQRAAETLAKPDPITAALMGLSA